MKNTRVRVGRAGFAKFNLGGGRGWIKKSQLFSSGTAPAGLTDCNIGKSLEFSKDS